MLWAQSAFAHVQSGEAAGLLTGFFHPISGLDHVLAMVAVGLWGAQLGAPAIWVLPVAFPLVMAMGGMLGFTGVPVPGIEYGIAASAILLGAAVTFKVRPPLVMAALLVGFFAVFHGYAHGTELPPGQSALLLQHGLRDCDRVFACCGDRHRCRPPMDVGTKAAARDRRCDRAGWCLLPVEGGRMKGAGRSRLATRAIAVCTLALCSRPAEAHLNSTGMGPIYDGLMHFLTSPEDLVPVLALAMNFGAVCAARRSRTALVGHADHSRKVARGAPTGVAARDQVFRTDHDEEDPGPLLGGSRQSGDAAWRPHGDPQAL